MKSKFRLSCMAMLATAAIGSLGSCSNDDLLEANINKLPENAIGFNVTQQGALSRGTETNSGNFQNQIKDFQVWAYFAKGATGTGVQQGGLYVGDSHTVGTKVNGDTKGAWSYDDVTKQQYWPATTAPLNFQAITPHSHSSFTIANTPDEGDPYLAHLSADVTVPTAVKDQQDIMFAKADGQTRETNSQTVGLNFEHAMSQVVFSGKLASDKIEATVHGIEIHNLHQTGKVGYTGTNAELQASTTGDAATTFAAGLVSDAKVTSSSQATVLSAADGALFMLPQTVAKWTTTAKNPVPTTEADKNHNSYMKVTCTVKDKASNVVLIDNGAIYIPLDVNWLQGKKYRYTLLFGDGENGFKPDGSHDDNLLQIKYNVSASDWNVAINEDLGIGGDYVKPSLIYKTGSNVKLVNKAEYCQSVIADGKELIVTGRESGELIVPELKDEKVYITFKDDVTDFSYAFGGYYNGCTSLKSIPENLFASNKNVTSFAGTFSGCTTLQSIPENLFANCPNATNFRETFSGCSALTAIPDNLFANNPLITNIISTFYCCTSLQSIPENLFENCNLIEDVCDEYGVDFQYYGTFARCTSLQSIPDKLFKNFDKVLKFSGIFYNCSSLQSIPSNLFANCTSAENFSSAFEGCISLTSIPEGLFANCPKVYAFGDGYRTSGTFKDCTSLQSIPENLFANNPAVTDFYGTFSNCISLKKIPEGLFAHNPKVTTFSTTFDGCSALTSIPEGLFANCPKVTIFSYTFDGCTSLQSIPENLFAHNPEVTKFQNTFSNCTTLQSIPTGLFDNNRKVINFTGTFDGCTSLTGESPYTMVDGKKVHLYERKNYPAHFPRLTGEFSFRGCTGLTDYAQIPSNWK